MPKRKLAAVTAAVAASASGAVVPTGPIRASCWLLKSEPSDYSISQLAAEGTTVWDGVRNAVARKNLRAMAAGDRCLFYHSSCKQIGVVGEATVCRTAYPDPADAKWAVVDIRFEMAWDELVSLEKLKSFKETSLQGMALFSQSRLSVQPVSTEHFEFIQGLGRGAPGSA